MKILTICAAGLLVLAVAALVSGTIPAPWHQAVAHPACEQLPSKDRVQQALSQHQELVGRIKQVGPGVSVGIGTPCGDQPSKALVQINYDNDAEKQGIDRVLAEADGFGVPAMPVRG